MDSINYVHMGYVLDTCVFKHPVQVHASFNVFENPHEVYVTPVDTGVSTQMKDLAMPLVRLAAQKPSAKLRLVSRLLSNLFQLR